VADTSTPEHGGLLSRQNDRIKRLRRLGRDRGARRDEGVYLIEGPTLVGEALDAGVALEGIYVEDDAFPDLVARASAAGLEVACTVSGGLERVLTTTTPQPIAAVARIVEPDPHALEVATFVVVLAGVADPGNAGALLRIAEGAGADLVVFVDDAVDPYNPKTVRASAGSVFRMPVLVAQGDEVLRSLGSLGVQRLGLVAEGGRLYDSIDLTVPIAVVLGNESEGLPAALSARIDLELTVPMAGATESLNVATAAAVVSFEAAKQRRAGGRTLSAVEVVNAVGHELRSPLTAVKGFTSMMLKRWERLEDDEKRQMLGEVNTEADRVTRVVGELLDISRLEIGKLRLQRRLLHLDQVADEVVEQLRTRFPELECRVDVPDDLPRVSADPDKVEQVIRNLIENAAKYASSEVEVAGAVEDGMVRVCVRDHGPGLSADELESVFLMRPKREGQNPSGSGFGLWISRALIEAHGGTLTATSEPGQGSAFCMSLPVYE
jgi:signal transduction histidine kinase